MTQKEKLKKLLEVAVENGCNNELVLYFFENINTIRFYDFTQSDFCLKFWVNDELFSLNDLVCNWEEGEVSFIEALCKADEWNIGLYLENNAIQSDYGWIMMNNWEQVIQLWSWDNKVQKGRPTSQRLNFLFETFKHLIQ
jgi:hypothetical protein